MEQGLVQINQAKTALAEAVDIISILDIRDKASAMATYYDAQNAGEAANLAKEIQLRAERKAGEFLKDMPKQTGGDAMARLHHATEVTPSYADLGIEKTEAFRWQLSSELPEPEFEAYIAKTLEKGNELTSAEVLRKAKQNRREERRGELALDFTAVEPDERYDIFQADINTVVLDKQFDFIVTDPPYPKEYLPLYEVLAKRAVEWLKPEGLLLAMCGQSYLDEIMTMMSKHLDYYWMACYYMPGQLTPLRQRQVNCGWKPILIYGNREYKGKVFRDTFISEKPDKEHHEWGQSVSGMSSIISQICLPGQTILDPFLGAGTTGLAALKNHCLFTGFDIDENEVNKSLVRMSEL